MNCIDRFTDQIMDFCMHQFIDCIEQFMNYMDQFMDQMNVLHGFLVWIDSWVLYESNNWII